MSNLTQTIADRIAVPVVKPTPERARLPRKIKRVYAAQVMAQIAAAPKPVQR